MVKYIYVRVWVIAKKIKLNNYKNNQQGEDNARGRGKRNSYK